MSLGKHLFLMVAVLVLPASAISPKRIESAQKRAASDGKLIAFVVEQEFWDPGCPKCVSTVSANNKQISRLAPRKNVIVIKLEKDDLEEGVVPDVVLNARGEPRLVITDAACTKAIDVLDAKADDKRVAEMEEKVAAALED